MATKIVEFTPTNVDNLLCRMQSCKWVGLEYNMKLVGRVKSWCIGSVNQKYALDRVGNLVDLVRKYGPMNNSVQDRSGLEERHRNVWRRGILSETSNLC